MSASMSRLRVEPSHAARLVEAFGTRTRALAREPASLVARAYGDAGAARAGLLRAAATPPADAR